SCRRSATPCTPSSRLTARKQAMIAPALAPATLTHCFTGFVGCSAKPSSAPASPMPFTPPPLNTPSASSFQAITTTPLQAMRLPLPDECPAPGNGSQGSRLLGGPSAPVAPDGLD